jgi:hypothetical protein
VTAEQTRGVLLYTLTAVLLIAGGLWWVRSAPPGPDDPRVEQWRAKAGLLLPDQIQQVKAETFPLASGHDADRNAVVTAGSYRVTMLCVADRGDVRVRFSTTDSDSGRAVPCAPAPTPVTLTIALADNFFLNATSESPTRAVIFRWRLERAGGL